MGTGGKHNPASSKHLNHQSQCHGTDSLPTLPDILCSGLALCCSEPHTVSPSLSSHFQGVSCSSQRIHLSSQECCSPWWRGKRRGTCELTATGTGLLSRAAGSDFRPPQAPCSLVKCGSSLYSFWLVFSKDTTPSKFSLHQSKICFKRVLCCPPAWLSPISAEYVAKRTPSEVAVSPYLICRKRTNESTHDACPQHVTAPVWPRLCCHRAGHVLLPPRAKPPLRAGRADSCWELHLQHFSLAPRLGDDRDFKRLATFRQAMCQHSWMQWGNVETALQLQTVGQLNSLHVQAWNRLMHGTRD